MKKLLISLMLFLGVAVQASEQEILHFENETQRQLYQQLTAELRCPQCQNQNIADSNAVVSEDMRLKTYELILEGKSRQEVLDYMINRYGYFVHYQPPLNRYTLLLWLAPLLMVLLLSVVLLKKRRQQPDEPEVPLSSELDSIIEAYRSKKS